MVARMFIRRYRLRGPTSPVPTHEYSTVDTHTAGMPTRVVVDGLTVPEGGSVRARRDSFAETMDDVRRFLVCEPRGHRDMFAAVPVEPTEPDADVGLFFLDAAGYLDMCGHATIGAITALVETGRLDAPGPITVETPAGLVETRPHLEDGHVAEVTFENVPAAFCETRTIHAGIHDEVAVDLVSAGNVCGIVDPTAVDLSLSEAPASRIADLGTALRDLVNEQGPVSDPISGRDREVSILEFAATDAADGTADDPGSGDVRHRTAVVFGDGAVDRSPCGTGTSARLTLRHHQDTLAVDEAFTHVGPTGESFSGRVTDATEGRCRTAITGSAHVIGHHTFVRAATDPLDAFTLD